MAIYPILGVDKPSLVCILLTSIKKVLVGLGVLAIGVAAMADDWHMFQHDRMNTGKSRNVGPDSASSYWTEPFKAEGDIWTCPVVGVMGGDTLTYIGTRSGWVYAIYTDQDHSPKEKWSYRPAHKSIQGMAVDVQRKKIYFGCDTLLYALNALTGDSSELWVCPIHSPITTPITIKGEYIYFGIRDRLYKVKTMHDTSWTFYTAPEILSGCAPAVDDTDAIYFQSADNLDNEPCYLRILAPDKTEIDWIEVGGESSPALVPDTIYIGSKYGYIYAITRTEVGYYEKVWKKKIGKVIKSSPAIGDDGRIYIGSDNGSIYCCIPSKDSIIPFPPTNGPIVAAPILDRDDNVYVGSQDSCFYSYTFDGKFRWKYKTTDKIRHPAAMAGGVVYVASGKYLYAGPGGPVGREETPSNLSFSFHILPNPSISTARIGFSLPKSGNIEMDIYSISGSLIKTLFKGYKEKGTHQVVWDGKNIKGGKVPAGVYFCRFSTPSSSVIKKIIMAK